MSAIAARTPASHKRGGVGLNVTKIFVTAEADVRCCSPEGAMCLALASALGAGGFEDGAARVGSLVGDGMSSRAYVMFVNQAHTGNTVESHVADDEASLRERVSVGRTYYGAPGGSSFTRVWKAEDHTRAYDGYGYDVVNV